jgi:hypothetical protein
VIPVLLQASAERMLEAREELESELAALRDAINEEVMSRPARRVRGGSERLAEAVAAYSDAFERKRESLTEPDEDGIRVIEGAVSVTGLMLPGDAVLTSSLAALDVVKTGRAEAVVEAPAQPGSLDRPRFLALVVKCWGGWRPRNVDAHGEKRLISGLSWYLRPWRRVPRATIGLCRADPSWP